MSRDSKGDRLREIVRKVSKKENKPIIHKSKDVLIRAADNGYIVTSFHERDDGSFDKVDTIVEVDDRAVDFDKADADAFVRAMYAAQDGLRLSFGWMLEDTF